MPSGVECLCCSEIAQVMAKRSSEEVECITLHPGFQTVCLDPWVLQTAYYSYRQQYGENAVEGALNEYVIATYFEFYYYINTTLGNIGMWHIVN